MKTIIYKGDKILWIFLASIFFLLTIKIATAQANSTNVLKLKITGNGYSDETYIRFKNGASEEYESNNDGWKLFSMNQNVPMIFTKIDGYAAALNTFPKLEKKVAMNVFTKIKNAGNYTIEAKIVSPFPTTAKLFFVDKLTNEPYNIMIDSIMNFNLSPDSGITARFQMYFATPAKFSASDLTCFKNKDGKILIENLCENGWEIEVTDENNIYHKNKSGNNESIIFSDLHGGKYTIKINECMNISNTFIATVGQPFPVLSFFEKSSETICICDGGRVEFFNNSTGATSYEWNFGDGTKSNNQQPIHNYYLEGEYIISLVVSDGQCRDTSYAAINVIENYPLSASEKNGNENVKIFWNGENYILTATLNNPQNIHVDVFNLLGQKIYSKSFSDISENQIEIKLPKINNTYIFSITAKDFSYTKLLSVI